MSSDLTDWTPCQYPERKVLDGRYVRLEPLDPANHGHELYLASDTPDADDKFRFLPEYPPENKEAFSRWVEQISSSTDPLFYAVIDKASGRVGGRQTLMRIDQANGCIEIGNIYWGPLIARRPAATEALFLFADYVFEDLGYRRFEWKCNDDNLPSKKAALRFGFKHEGVFRQHMIVKGMNRDTAWFAMLDTEWPALKDAFIQWLSSENFQPDGTQLQSLGSLTRCN